MTWYDVSGELKAPFSRSLSYTNAIDQNYSHCSEKVPHSFTVDSHQPVLADSVARKNFPMCLIVTKATQARSPLRYHPCTWTFLVASDHRCRPLKGTEVVCTIAAADSPDLLSFCIGQRWRAFVAMFD
jgi:hypothetical protein